MGVYRKIDTLKRFLDWVKFIQKDINKIGRDVERKFDDELESNDGEIIEFLDSLGNLYSITDNLKEYSANLIQKYSERDNF